jgi:hypothetical protein
MNDKLITELRNLTSGWNQHDLVPLSEQLKCQDIGERLYEAGGMSLMQDAYYEAKAKNRAASVIASYWDGIGEWRW